MVLANVEATRRFARKLAQALPEGTLVLLTGPLGAGKTTLVKFIAEALGFKGEVTSPTYTLIHEYPTPRGPIVHIDAYRLADAGLDFIKTEHLYTFDGKPGYSLGPGQ